MVRKRKERYTLIYLWHRIDQRNTAVVRGGVVGEKRSSKVLGLIFGDERWACPVKENGKRR